MRGAHLAVALVVAGASVRLGSISEARVVVRRPTIDWLCKDLARGPLMKCVKEHAATFEAEPAKGVLLFKDSVFRYVFVLDAKAHAQFATKYVLSDEVLVDSSEHVELSGVPVHKVELRTARRLDTSRADVLRKREAMLCQPSLCQAVTVECTHMRDGRAFEVFLGHIVANGKYFHVEGDHTKERACN